MASRLFRNIARGAPKLFQQVRSDANVLGRQITNTAKQVNQGLGQAQKFVGDVERTTAGTPISTIAKTVGQALKVGQDVSGAAVSGGTALRQAAAGDLKGALASGQQAVSGIQSAATDGVGLATAFV